MGAAHLRPPLTPRVRLRVRRRGPPGRPGSGPRPPPPPPPGLRAAPPRRHGSGRGGKPRRVLRREDESWGEPPLHTEAEERGPRRPANPPCRPGREIEIGIKISSCLAAWPAGRRSGREPRARRWMYGGMWGSSSTQLVAECRAVYGVVNATDLTRRKSVPRLCRGEKGLSPLPPQPARSGREPRARRCGRRRRG